MVVFLASYFFDEEPFHLGDWFVRAENRVQQWWTLPYVPGNRYLDKDVYILLSRRSFSAVEGLSSILQHHKRACDRWRANTRGHASGKIRTRPPELCRLCPNELVHLSDRYADLSD